MPNDPMATDPRPNPQMRGRRVGAAVVLGDRSIHVHLEAPPGAWPLVHTYFRVSRADGTTGTSHAWSASAKSTREIAAMLNRAADEAEAAKRRRGPEATRIRDVRRAIAHNELRAKGAPPASYVATMALTAAAAPTGNP